MGKDSRACMIFESLLNFRYKSEIETNFIERYYIKIDEKDTYK